MVRFSKIGKVTKLALFTYISKSLFFHVVVVGFCPKYKVKLECPK